ncbi:hypothetical protein EI94DRAFT_1723649 [Lactarius quietus]|nr:hypothetical protein EI94DRAFT_1723649 [Lactarius quietus]
MAPKKGVPHRIGFTNEPRFPKNRRNLLKPVHGATPRCRVDYSPEDDGPWTAIQIMRIDEDGSIEHYMCAMPRYYAIPLILLNKRLAYAEAQCTPDGTPLSLGDGSQGLKLRDLKEFTYLWRVRCRFLQGVFDMNHEQQLDEAWRWDRIHGYMHRTYKRYGHDISQRYAYWKDEIEAGRMPYSKPDIADMDWQPSLEETTTSTCLNAFLWNRVSQGYARHVQDDPPYASWQAAALFSTPPSSPEQHSRSPEEPDSAAEEEVEVMEDVNDEETAAAAASHSVNVARGITATISCSATICDPDNDMDGGDGSSEWAGLPMTMSDWSRGASQAAASTSGTAELNHRRILFALDVPNGVAVTDLSCWVSHVGEDGEEHETKFSVECDESRKGKRRATCIPRSESGN